MPCAMRGVPGAGCHVHACAGMCVASFPVRRNTSPSARLPGHRFARPRATRPPYLGRTAHSTNDEVQHTILLYTIFSPNASAKTSQWRGFVEKGGSRVGRFPPVRFEVMAGRRSVLPVVGGGQEARPPARRSRRRRHAHANVGMAPGFLPSWSRWLPNFSVDA
jgi:hypothetical protein